MTLKDIQNPDKIVVIFNQHSIDRMPDDVFKLIRYIKENLIIHFVRENKIIDNKKVINVKGYIRVFNHYFLVRLFMKNGILYVKVLTYLNYLKFHSSKNLNFGLNYNFKLRYNNKVNYDKIDILLSDLYFDNTYNDVIDFIRSLNYFNKIQKLQIAHKCETHNYCDIFDKDNVLEYNEGYYFKIVKLSKTSKEKKVYLRIHKS